jgi:hypothetical protein
MRQGRRTRSLAALAVVVIALLVAVAFRSWFHATMTRHMVLQLPLLVVLGAMAAALLPRRWRRRLAPWNPGGGPGLVVGVTGLAAAMVPRVLDLAVASASADAAKVAVLVLAGAALQLGWRPAGVPGQAFVVGNATWMAAALGLVLRELPVRVCASYLEGDQRAAGTGLVLLAAGVGASWVALRLLPPARPTTVRGGTEAARGAPTAASG